MRKIVDFSGVSGFRAARHTRELRSAGAGFGVSVFMKNNGLRRIISHENLEERM